jgi:Mg-chelatase subunit ChlD
MIHLFNSRSKNRGLRRAGAAIAGVLVAGGAMLTAGPAAMAAAADGPPAASPNAVATALGISQPKAEIVILVDMSVSMGTAHNDLYSEIRSDLNTVLGTLAAQRPNDRVAIIEFAANAYQIYDGAPSTRALARLSTEADQGGTDIGAAFRLARQTLQNDVGLYGIRAGAMLLLSDGELYAPNDPGYASYGASGWGQLRASITGLSVNVTGYGLRLTSRSGQSYRDDLRTALQAVFGTPDNIAPSTTDLIGDLEALGQNLLDRQVASAVAQDSGKGVRVTWGGLPGVSGDRPLNLTSAGHMTVEVTLMATTRRVPLSLTRLSVESSGLSGAISGTLDPPDRTLAPGQSITVPVHLTWQPKPSGVAFSGDPQTRHGQLVLVGRVYSTYTQTIRDGFNDKSFSTGGLIGASSAPFAALTPIFLNLLLILFILVIIVVVLAALAFVRFRMLLSGSFTITSVDYDSGVIPLSRWRWRPFVGMEDVIGIPGRMTVRGHLRGMGMKIGLRLENRPDSELELAPGGRTMIAGIDIVHNTNSSSK